MTTVVNALEELEASHLDLNERKMSIIDDTGDTEVKWNHNNADEVAAARATFDSLKRKGYTAYALSAGGGRGAVIAEFDQTVERMVLAPRVVGG